jgi:hypothetical protein
MADVAFQRCINPACGAEFDCGQAIFKCPKVRDLLACHSTTGTKCLCR